jgi:putative PEP-CTERM system TPR-repeat lipoprotein
MSNDIKQTKNRLFKVLALFCLFSIQACNPTQDYSNYMVEVKSQLEQGTPQNAIILLKNVLSENSQDSVARLALGNIYLDIGNLLSAKKEINIAYKLSPESPETIVGLAKLFVHLNEFEKVEQLFSNRGDWPSELIVESYAIQSQVDIYQGYLEQADETLTKAAQINAKHPDVLYSLALLKSQQLSFSKADEYLEQLLAYNPNHFAGILLKGDIALKNEYFDEAIELFEKANKIVRVDNLAKIKLAQALIEANKLDTAKEQLLKYLKATPYDAYINYLLARIEFTQKNYENSAQFAEKTLSNSVKHPDSLYIASASNYLIKNYESAYNQVRKLLVIMPEHAASLKLRAALELKLGLNEQAATTLAQIEDSTFTASDSELIIAAGLASIKTGEIELGKQFFVRADALNADKLQSKLALASVALQQDDVKSAIAVLSQAVERVPQSQQANIALTLSYIKDRQPEKALKVAQKISLDHVQSPYGPMLEGLVYVMEQQLKNAESAFMRALSIRPGHPNTTHLLAALVMQQSKDVKRARRLYESAIKQYPDDITSLIELYVIDREAGKKEQSINWLEQAIDISPEKLKPRLLLAQYYLSNNEVSKSLMVSKKALKVHPEHPSLLALLGDAQRHVGQQKASIASYQKLQKIAPEMFFPHYRLAEVYEKTGQLEMARESVTRALELKPKHLGGLVIRARIALKEGDVESAKTIVKSLDKSKPHSLSVTKLQAQIALSEQRSADAVNLYREILAKQETNYNTIHLSSALWQQSKRQKAIDTLITWLNKHPKDIMTMNVLADYYLNDNQDKEAGKLYSKLVVLTPNNSLAHNNLAWLLLKQNNNIDTALKHATQANQLSPNTSDFLDTLGLVHYSKGDYSAAKKAFSDAVSLQPNVLDIQFHLAQSHAKIGEKLQAEKMLEHLLTQQDTFSSSIEAKELLNQLRAEQ